MTKHPRVTAVHEAGHVVAAIRLGSSVKGVHLRTAAEVRRGDLIEMERGKRTLAHGLAEGAHHTNPAFARLLAGNGAPQIPVPRGAVVADVATCMAGPTAEARYSRRGYIEVVLCGGGSGDWADAQDHVETFGCGREVLDEGSRLARRLVRHHWHQVLAVADLIQGRRFTDGEQIAELLERLELPRWNPYGLEPLVV